ncbi:MAG: hypothetical protein H7255_13020 [Ramlibacter sp.]|nr:hypothetical protein [Ramlibacter sp.]
MPFERASQTKSAAPGAAPRCKVKLGVVSDARRNKASIGAANSLIYPEEAPNWYASTPSGDVKKWLRDGLETLPVLWAEQGEVNVDVAILMAQVWRSYRINSHVALQATFETPQGPVTRRYQGFGTKTNWVGGNQAIMSMMNAGLTDALDALAVDISAACSGLALTPAPE